MLASTKWKVYTNGTRLKRIVVNGKYTSQSMEVELTDAMEKMLQRAGIEYHDGKDLKGQIVEKVLKPKLLIFFDSQFRCGIAEVSRKTENMTG